MDCQAGGREKRGAINGKCNESKNWGIEKVDFQHENEADCRPAVSVDQWEPQDLREAVKEGVERWGGRFLHREKSGGGDLWAREGGVAETGAGKASVDGTMYGIGNPKGFRGRDPVQRRPIRGRYRCAGSDIAYLKGDHPIVGKIGSHGSHIGPRLTSERPGVVIAWIARGRNEQWGCGVEGTDQRNRGNGAQSRRGTHLLTVPARSQTQERTGGRRDE